MIWTDEPEPHGGPSPEPEKKKAMSNWKEVFIFGVIGLALAAGSLMVIILVVSSLVSCASPPRDDMGDVFGAQISKHIKEERNK